MPEKHYSITNGIYISLQPKYILIFENQKLSKLVIFACFDNL